MIKSGEPILTVTTGRGQVLTVKYVTGKLPEIFIDPRATEADLMATVKYLASALVQEKHPHLFECHLGVSL